MGMVGTINEAAERCNRVMTHSTPNELIKFESQKPSKPLATDQQVGTYERADR